MHSKRLGDENEAFAPSPDDLLRSAGHEHDAHASFPRQGEKRGTFLADQSEVEKHDVDTGPAAVEQRSNLRCRSGMRRPMALFFEHFGDRAPDEGIVLGDQNVLLAQRPDFLKQSLSFA